VIFSCLKTPRTPTWGCAFPRAPFTFPRASAPTPRIAREPPTGLELRRRLPQANLCRQASLEDIDWRSPRRALDKALVQSVATCAWIAQHRNVILIGPTEIAKSWLEEAFAERTCRSGYSAYCVRTSRLFLALHVARGDGSYTRTVARLAKIDLLVVDHWGLAALTSAERQDLLEILASYTWPWRTIDHTRTKAWSQRRTGSASAFTRRY